MTHAANRCLLTRSAARCIAAALVLLGVAGLACDDHSYPEVDCDTVEVKGFAEMSVWSSCTSCHSSDREGADRQSAPAGVDFDSFEAAMAEADHAAGEVANDEMPPGGGLSEDAKNELYAWAQCGTPQ